MGQPGNCRPTDTPYGSPPWLQHSNANSARAQRRHVSRVATKAWGKMQMRRWRTILRLRNPITPCLLLRTPIWDCPVLSLKDEPPAEQIAPQNYGTSQGTCPPGTIANKDRETMPFPPPRPPDLRDTGALVQAALGKAYDIYQNTPPHAMADTLQRKSKGLHTNSRFAVTSLSHGATNIYVGEVETLLSPEASISDNLVNVSVRWLNLQQPTQEQMWVTHVSQRHTLIALPAKHRLAPTAGGREKSRTAADAKHPRHPAVK